MEPLEPAVLLNSFDRSEFFILAALWSAYLWKQYGYFFLEIRASVLLLSPLFPRVYLSGLSTKLETALLVAMKDLEGVSLGTSPNISTRKSQRHSLLLPREMFLSWGSCARCPPELPPLPCGSHCFAQPWAWPPTHRPMSWPAFGLFPPSRMCPMLRAGAALVPSSCLAPNWGGGTALVARLCPGKPHRDPLPPSGSLQAQHCRGSEPLKVSTAIYWPISPVVDNQANLFCDTTYIKTEQTPCNRLWRES